MLERGDSDGRSPLKRGWILAGALFASALACTVALLLGAWGFGFHQYTEHENRIQRLVRKEPKRDVVELAMANDGSPLIEAPDNPTAVEKVARSLGGPKVDEVLAKGRRWPTTRVFRARGMLYFLYFDGQDVLRDYTCVSG